MKFEYNPYPKSKQLGDQKEKDTPPFKVRKYNRRKKQTKKVDYKGVKIPSRAKRGDFTQKHKEQIMEIYGDKCLICGSPYIEFHHRKFRSGLGRNNPRNGAPLCNGCHRTVHDNAELAQMLRDEAIERFGEYYYLDKYDLWKKGLIDRPTDELFEKFMEEQEKEREKRDKTSSSPQGDVGR